MQFMKILTAILLTLTLAMPTMAAEKDKKNNPEENRKEIQKIVQDEEEGSAHKVAEQEAEEDPKEGIVLEPVVVTATRTEITAFEAPASIVVLDEEEIAREQGTTLRDILDGIPNVDFASGTTPYLQVPSIRGLDDEQTIIKIDGAKQQYNDNAGNAKAPVVVDPVLLKQVEVLRGPSSTLHGSGGIGGVISMRTKDAFDFLKPGENYGATVKTGYQSVDAQKHVTAVAYGRYNDLSFVASATNRGFGNMQTTDPTNESPFLDRTGYSQTQFLKTTFTPGNHYLSLSYQNFNDRYSYPSGSWFESQQNQTTLNYDVAEGDWLDLKFSAQYTWRKNEDKDSRSFVADTFSAWSGDLQNTIKFGPEGLFRNAVTFGVDFQANNQEGTRDGQNDASRPKVLSKDYGVFIQDEIQLPAGFTLIPALRYTHYTRDPKDLDFPAHDEGRLTPKFTMEYQPADWIKFFSTYAESFRPPSASEMYLYMAWPGGTVIPNTSLKPETGRTYEFGTALGFDRVFAANDPMRVKFVYFRETIEDFITAGPLTGSWPNFSVTTINEGKVKRYGFEAELSYAYKDVFAAVSYGKVMGRDEDDEICGATPEQINIKLNWDIPQYDLDLTWKSQFTGESKDHNPAFGNSETVDSYNIHGIGLVWGPQDLWGYEGLRVDMGLDNIFDEKYKTYRGGLDKGRNFKVTLSLEF